MGKLIPLARPRAASVVARRSDTDWEFVPIATLLLVASWARVVCAIWRHEPFHTEPTFALAFALGLPWLAWRWFRKTR